jgi:GTPase SAR1 family protein
VRAEVTEDCVVGLAGNKCDRKDRQVPQSEGTEFARRFAVVVLMRLLIILLACFRENILFFETSAKENKNIDEMFAEFARQLAQQILKNTHKETAQKISLDGQTTRVNPSNNEGCGC